MVRCSVPQVLMHGKIKEWDQQNSMTCLATYPECKYVFNHLHYFDLFEDPLEDRKLWSTDSGPFVETLKAWASWQNRMHEEKNPNLT